jgi:hypothetical protein
LRRTCEQEIRLNSSKAERLLGMRCMTLEKGLVLTAQSITAGG